ncbi:MAG: alpha/beta hydrolase [Candidatus Hodarchaeales archaeon]|jgi:enterochelin esterase family protein
MKKKLRIINRKLGQIIPLMFVLLLGGLSFSSPSTALPSFTFTDFYDFLDQYETTATDDKPTIIGEYVSWQNSTGGGFPAIVNHTHVVFIYYDPTGSVTNCKVCHDAISDPGNPNVFADHNMTQLEPGISFFYLGFTLRPTTRIGYQLCVDGSWTNDPRNPYQCEAWQDFYISELAMPLFEREFYHVYRPEVPHGTVTPLTNYSTTPYIRIYLPPNFTRTTVYPVIYFPDGEYYIDFMHTTTMIDNLLADNLITPLIAVFSNYVGDRAIYYTDKVTYIDDLDSLVAHIDNTYPTITSREGRLHVGLSGSGFASAIVGLELSNTFRNIAIQSMAFWSEDITTTYSDADPSLDLNFWISCGTYELWGAEDNNRSEDTERVAEFFVNKTWDVSLHFYPEGHVFPFWTHTMDELLIHFFPPSFIRPTTTPTVTNSFYLFPVLLVLLIASPYRRKQQ